MLGCVTGRVTSVTRLPTVNLGRPVWVYAAPLFPRLSVAPRTLASMADEPLELGEIAFSDWHAHTDKLAGVGFLAIARRLPFLVSQAMRMAWRASPRDTVATVGLNLLGGVFTAFGLLATTGVLSALFREG